MWNFMLIYAKYPQYSKLDLYIIGESYTGHCEPAIGKAIVARNSTLRSELEGHSCWQWLGGSVYDISCIKFTVSTCTSKG